MDEELIKFVKGKVIVNCENTIEYADLKSLDNISLFLYTVLDIYSSWLRGQKSA